MTENEIPEDELLDPATYKLFVAVWDKDGFKCIYDINEMEKKHAWSLLDPKSDYNFDKAFDVEKWLNIQVLSPALGTEIYEFIATLDSTTSAMQSMFEYEFDNQVSWVKTHGRPFPNPFLEK